MQFERGKEIKEVLDIGIASKIKNAKMFIAINWGTDLCKPQNKDMIRLAELYFEVNTGYPCKIMVVDDEHIKLDILPKK